ncbi:hypothetical protein [Sphingomonas sp. MMS24-J13]|uniref:hypothetical protein n=1 Tax=Sphingomonas sp. MMS24-J13 TaxID=3238686 RepID=UPI00384F44BA
MTLLAFLTSTLIGGRSALVLLALMALFAWSRSPRSVSALDWHRSATWGLISLAVLLFAPSHLAWLLGHPFPLVVARSLDLAAVLTTCAALIFLLATRALIRGVSLVRVQRGMAANVSVVAGFILAAWLFHR